MELKQRLNMNIKDLFLAEDVLIIALSVFFILIILGDLLNYTFLNNKNIHKPFEKITLYNISYLLYGFGLINFFQMMAFLLVYFLKCYSNKIYFEKIESKELFSNRSVVFSLFLLIFISFFNNVNLFNVICCAVQIIYLIVVLRNNKELNEKIFFLLKDKAYNPILDKVNFYNLSERRKELFFESIYRYKFDNALILSDQISKEELIRDFVIFYYKEKMDILVSNTRMKIIILSILNNNKLKEELFYSNPNPNELLLDDFCFDRNSDIDKEYRNKYFLFLIEKVENKCPICGRTDNGIELDHFFIPKKEGGNFILKTKNGIIINNAIPLCISCNRSKSDKRAIDFLSSDKYQELVKLQKEIKRELFE